MRISDWSSDVCSSDLRLLQGEPGEQVILIKLHSLLQVVAVAACDQRQKPGNIAGERLRQAHLTAIRVNHLWAKLLAQRRQSLAQTLTRLHLEAPTPEQAGKFLARVRLPGVAREKGEQRTRPHSGQGDLTVRAGKREPSEQSQIRRSDERQERKGGGRWGRT